MLDEQERHDNGVHERRGGRFRFKHETRARVERCEVVRRACSSRRLVLCEGRLEVICRDELRWLGRQKPRRDGLIIRAGWMAYDDVL